MGARTFFRSVFLLSLFVVIFPNTSFADWHWRNPLPQGDVLNAVACGGATCVAVGGDMNSAINGTVVRSTDGGNSWTFDPVISAGIQFPLNGIVYANNTFIAVGGTPNGPDAPVVLSKDGGESWTTAAFPHSGLGYPVVKGVTYGNGTFIAVAADGSIYKSSDGTAWTTTVSATSSGLNAVTYANGTFVAVGHSGTIFTSTDGSAWTPRTSPTSVELLAVAYGNGIIVAVGADNSYGGAALAVISSDGGMTWSSAPMPGLPVTPAGWAAPSWPKGILFNSGKFLVTGAYGYLGTSSNGTAWTLVKTKKTGLYYMGLNGAASSGPTLLAVGDGGTVISSADGGVTWTKKAGDKTNPAGAGFGGAGQLRSVAYGKGVFVGASSYGYIIRSADGGKTWTSPYQDTSHWFYGAAYGNGVFVVVGSGGDILVSTDTGKTWLSKTSDTPNQLNNVSYGSGEFVAVGVADTALHSTDNGKSWRALQAPSAPLDNESGIKAGASNEWNSYCRTRCPDYPDIVGIAVGAAGAGGLAGIEKKGVAGLQKVSASLNKLNSVDSIPDTNIVVAVGFDVITISTDCGQTWHTLNLPDYPITAYNSVDLAYKGKFTDRVSSYGQFALVDNQGQPHTLIYWGGNWELDYKPITLRAPSLAEESADSASLADAASDPILTDTTGNTNALFGLTTGDGTLVAVGNNGTVLQSDAIPGLCTITLSPVAATFGKTGGTGTITVSTSAADCYWTAESNVPWISFISAAGGNGSATVAYFVDAETGSTPKTGTISVKSVNDQTFKVIQTGTILTYKISGSVKTTSGSPVKNVLMTLDGGATNKTVNTDSNGNYQFRKLVNGSYTVTPGKQGLTFTPVNRTVNINGSKETGQDFTVSK